MTHTPGPWEAKRTGYSISGRAEGPFYWAVTAPTHLRCVAEMLAEEDACLIAASPTMLEALKDAQFELMFDDIDIANRKIVREKIAVAIAKAEVKP